MGLASVPGMRLEEGSMEPRLLPFCCGVTAVCWGNRVGGKVAAKAPAGGAVWGMPGPELFIPKLGPVEGHRLRFLYKMETGRST